MLHYGSSRLPRLDNRGTVVLPYDGEKSHLLTTLPMSGIDLTFFNMVAVDISLEIEIQKHNHVFRLSK